MAEIRHARPADVDRLLAMGRSLHAESPRYRRVAWDEERARAITEAMAADPESGLFVAEASGGMLVGMIAGFVVPHWFSRSTFASDLTVYVDPEHRGRVVFLRLVGTFEQWARAQGAIEILLGVSTDIHPEQTVRVYERLGYKMSSFALMKET